MQYVDRNTNLSRLDTNVRSFIESILQNRRIFTPDDEDPPFVTEAVKYRSEPQLRRKTSPYSGDNEFVKDILDLFGFDPLDFQVECWQTVDNLDKCRNDTGESQAAIFSAPTGFGKTEAFLGPLYQLLRDDRQGGAAIVYPSRALLQDQLERILEHIHSINQNEEHQLSVGVYVGKMPYKMGDVRTNNRFFNTEYTRPRFKFANCWCGTKASPNQFKLKATKNGYVLRCESDPSHCFTDRELMLSRMDMVFDDPPDIVLTTLESLEGFALKPNYELIDNIETIVLDEVHLNTQLRGAHASKIINNIDALTDHPLLWLGSSATINNPSRFGKQLFGVEDISIIEPPESDFDDDHDDREHYYFILTARDGPGVSSTFIQQHLLFGHSLLKKTDGERQKMLSFIDSISQVNQKHTQLVDADQTQKLWQYHTDSGIGDDWPAVAAKMGNQFIDDSLSYMQVYSDRGFDSATVANSDVLLSTSFLEVGIDVGKINTIMQYRTPQNLSSFQQRVGRAAREKGTDAHVAVTLSDLTSDANMFYRADRFLDSDIRTPLNTENNVVKWIHDRFGEYFEVASEINSDRHTESQHELFIETYIGSQLGYEEYKEFILSPAEFLNAELGIEFSVQDLLSEDSVVTLSDRIETYLNGIQAEFNEIESLFDMDNGNIIRGEGAVGTYVRKLQTQVLEVINTFSDQISTFKRILDSNNSSPSDIDIRALQSELSDLRKSASQPPDGDPESKIQYYQSHISDLFKLNGELMQLQIQVNKVSDDHISESVSDELGELRYAISQLTRLTGNNKLRSYYREQKQLLYLDNALNELKEYAGYQSSFKSLYAVRNLLRGAYYFDQYLQVDDRTLGEVWYVPPNYYGDSGRFFSVFEPNSRASKDTSIDEIVGKYAPFQPKYQSDSHAMHLFLPHTRVTDEGVVFEFAENIDGEVRNGILVPDSIELTSVPDRSGDAAKSIVRYCPECYQILSSENCVQHDEGDFGKIFSTPHIITSVTNRTIDNSIGSFSIANVTAEASLDGVTLDIRPASRWGGSVNFDEREPREARINCPDESIGFTLDTRGLVFDITSFIDRVMTEEVRSIVYQYKDCENIKYEEIAYHTAAHFVLQLVADVSAVNTSLLFYGYDTESGEIYVFERTQGGQGIVDLVFDEISSNPHSILEAITQIGYNPQVINERLWADNSFISALPDETTDEKHIKNIVTEYLNVPFDIVSDRTTQEVISTIDKASQFANTEGISLQEAYQIKHTIAKKQITGKDKFPKDAVKSLEAQFSSKLSDLDSIENVFVSPDIDGCVENLHLSDCAAAASQSESLSYVLLELLREELLHMGSAKESFDETSQDNLVRVGDFNGTNVSLDI